MLKIKMCKKKNGDLNRGNEYTQISDVNQLKKSLILA